MKGELPKGPCIYAACDSIFFEEHAPSLIYSANDIKKDVHIHVCNPTESVLSIQDKLRKTTDINVTFSYNEKSIIEDGHRKTAHTYYASLRFLYVHHIIRAAKKVLVTDVDCLFKNDFKWPEESYGYFPRRNRRINECVAAGVVYFTEESLKTIELLQNKIINSRQEWFADQIALGWYFNEVVTDKAKHFDEYFMDWDFKKNSVMWTGKGDRKYNNQIYVQAKKEFNRL